MHALYRLLQLLLVGAGFSDALRSWKMEQLSAAV